jgi:uncharacterized repeat protein (TIGR01451 family)
MAHETPFEGCLERAPNVTPNAPVQVCKTVEVVKVTTWSWTLTKAARPTDVALARDASADVEYTFVATPKATVGYVVSGVVYVRNHAPSGVTFTVTDALAVPGAGARAITLASDAALPGHTTPGAKPPEAAYPYSFDIAAPTGAGANTGSVTYSLAGGGTGADAHTVPVAFTGVPELVYNRKVLLSDALAGVAGSGLTATPDAAGPYSVTADNPASQTRTLAGTVTNSSLACGTSRPVVDTATLTSPTTAPEVTGTPATPPPLGPAVNETATATVNVAAPPCSEKPIPPTPPVTTGTPTPKPKPPGKKPRVVRRCPVPKLALTLGAPAAVQAGQVARFTLTVSNSSRNTARNVVVRMPLPSGFSRLGATRTLTLQNGVLVMRAGTLGRNQTRTVAVTLRVDRTARGRRSSRATTTARCDAAAAVSRPLQVAGLGGPLSPAVTG